MARTKLPAVKRREYTVEEYNALFHAGRKGGGTGTGTGRGRGGISRAARWDARLVEVKAWVVRYGRYPGTKTPAETSMYRWLRNNLPGKESHTPDRWKKLNDAFGEGWEADFGREAHESRLEAKWDARLVQVKAWVVRYGRYPSSSMKTPAERSMNQWLRDNLPGKKSHTPDRWKKLNDAFGEGWENDFGREAHESRLEAKWDARLAEVKAWVVEKGDFPRPRRRASEEERSMYDWLRENLPGKKMYTPARRKKLNDAFGEDWEAGFKTGSPGHLEAKWDARLLEVKAWVVEKGDFPRTSKEERSMYNWLYANLPGHQNHTPDRWKKLNDAFGEDWEADLLRRKRPREA